MSQSEKFRVLPAIRNKEKEIVNFPAMPGIIRALKLVEGDHTTDQEDLYVNALQGQSIIICVDGKGYLPEWKNSNETYIPIHDLPALEAKVEFLQVVRWLSSSEAFELRAAIATPRRCIFPTRKQIENEMPEILVRYHKSENTDDPIIELEQIHVGDWIDLRSRDEVHLKENEHAVIKLAVSMQLPPEYEGIIAARSSTWLQHGVIYASSIGVIDNSYCGDDDIWHMPVYATRDTIIKANERICQFRIQKRMGRVKLTTVEKLENANRGGFGHTGRM